MAFTLLDGTGFEPGSINVVELYTGGTWAMRTASPAPRTGNYYLANSSNPSQIYAQFDVTGGSNDVYVAAANYPVAGGSDVAAARPTWLYQFHANCRGSVLQREDC